MKTIATDLLTDVRIAIAFLTRVLMPHPDGAQPASFVRAHRAFPLVGAAIGLIVALLYLGMTALGLPNQAAAALALGASALLTGALHEDGLANMADGFGGGRDKATKLEIMRDSRLGTYGALILLVGFAAKLSALAALPKAVVVPALVTCHALARGILAAMIIALPPARKDGLAAAVGTPSHERQRSPPGQRSSSLSSHCRGPSRSPQPSSPPPAPASSVYWRCGRSAGRRRCARRRRAGGRDRDPVAAGKSAWPAP